MYRPGLNEASKLTGDFSVIPVSCEFFSDIKTPIQVLKSIRSISACHFLLESVEGGEKWGRYSFLGFDPVVDVKCRDGVVTVSNGATIEIKTDDPGEVIKGILGEYKSPKFDYLPPFTGGFVGYFAYDYIKYAEKSLVLNGADEVGFDDVDLMLFDKVVAFDHLRQKIILIVNIKTDNLEQNYNRAIVELEKMAGVIKGPAPEPLQPERSGLRSAFIARFDKDQFCGMVTETKRHIVDGDIFQAVVSNRFEADFEGGMLDTYRVLRTSNPSPYMFFIKYGDFEITGASPETLIKLQGRDLTTFPIAGTKPRGKDEAEDELLMNELLSDPKELSEHNMLVDLGRNDIGRISGFGSVAVKDYLKVVRFSHVMHIASTVTGKLRGGLDAFDAISAALPAGTLSGAPKIRACEIINSLEKTRRGVYGGAIGYMDFAGNMDMCIAIRMAVKKNGRVYVQTGAGIVADSVPESEYDECANKAKAMFQAFEISGKGMEL